MFIYVKLHCSSATILLRLYILIFNMADTAAVVEVLRRGDAPDLEARCSRCWLELGRPDRLDHPCQGHRRLVCRHQKSASLVERRHPSDMGSVETAAVLHRDSSRHHQEEDQCCAPPIHRLLCGVAQRHVRTLHRHRRVTRAACRVNHRCCHGALEALCHHHLRCHQDRTPRLSDAATAPFQRHTQMS